MTESELPFLSAAELGRRMARREISPVEVARSQLERIERLNPSLNCYLTVTADAALEEARRAEARIAAGKSHGPWDGVPIGWKDIFDTAGVRTTAGAKILANHVPAEDATVVERLRGAGAVSLGKLNMHEFAYGTTTDNPHYGPCRNPWDRERIAGGSSGGSGAALAAGLCYLSVGTDTGGSIRIPASVCGCVGLKPTFGRVSRNGVLPLAWSLDHVGPMARTVEDAALLLGLLAGRDPADAWSADEPVPDFLRDLDAGVAGLRLGVPLGMFSEGLETEVAGTVEAAIRLLESLGAQVSVVELPDLAHGYTAFHAILASEASTYHLPWMRSRAAEYGEQVRRSLLPGYFIPAVDYLNAKRMQRILGAELLEALEERDAIVTATLPRTAPLVGESMSREPSLAWNRFLTPFNLAGLPAISIPCGFDRGGLPIGLQIAGRPFDEATVLRVARAYERETGWGGRRPPLAE